MEYMSSLMAAWMYIADSRDKLLCDTGSFFILSRIIQNILDGKYQNSKNLYLDYIHYKDQQESALRVNIVGISLWNTESTVHICDKDGIHRHTNGVRWDISILYENYGEILGVNLNRIRLITRQKVWPIVLQGTTHEARMLSLLNGTSLSRDASSPQTELV
jgi:hypothetical protein